MPIGFWQKRSDKATGTPAILSFGAASDDFSGKNLAGPEKTYYICTPKGRKRSDGGCSSVG